MKTQTLEQVVSSTRSSARVLEKFLQHHNLIVPYEEALAANTKSERLGLDLNITREILRWSRRYSAFHETCANYANGMEIEKVLFETLFSHYPKPILENDKYLKFDLSTALENVTEVLGKNDIASAFSTAELKLLLDTDLMHDNPYLSGGVLSSLKYCSLDFSIDENKQILLIFADTVSAYDKERYRAACTDFEVYCATCCHYNQDQYEKVLNELTEKKEDDNFIANHLNLVFAKHLPEYFAPDKKAARNDLITHIISEQCFCDMEDSLLELLAEIAKYKPNTIDKTSYFKHIISALSFAGREFNIHARIAYSKLTKLVALSNAEDIIMVVSPEQLGHNIANADLIELKFTLAESIDDEKLINSIATLCTPLTDRHSDKNILQTLLATNKNIFTENNIEMNISFLHCLNEIKAHYQDKFNLRLFFQLVSDTAVPLLNRCLENNLGEQYLNSKLKQVDRFLREITNTSTGKLTTTCDQLFYANYTGWDVPMSFFKEVLNKLHLIDGIDHYSEEKLFNLLELICKKNIRATSLTMANMGIIQDFNFMTTIVFLNKNKPDLFADDTFSRLEVVLQSMTAYAKHNASVTALHNKSRSFTQAYQKLQALFVKHPEVIDKLETLDHIEGTFSRMPNLMIGKTNLEVDCQTINAILDPIVTHCPELLLASRERVDQFISTILQRLDPTAVKRLDENLPMNVLCLLDEGFELKHLMARCFSTLYASIATFEPTQYQYACTQLEQLFDGHDCEKTRSRIFFTESVMIPVLKNSGMSLGDQDTWTFLQHVRHKIERLSSDKIKIQVFLRHFFRNVMTKISFAQTVLKNFDTLEAIFRELEHYPHHTINAICSGILSNLLIERPEAFQDTSAFVDTIRSAAKVFVSLNALNIKEDVVALLSTDDPLNTTNFFKMVCRINRNLVFNNESADKLTRIFKKIHSLIELKKLKLILQYNDDLNDIIDVIDKEFMLPSQRPSRQQFVCLEMADQVSWLKYYSIMRVRDGLGMLSYVLKHVQSYPEEAIIYTLRGLNRIRLPLSSKKINCVKALLQHESVTVRCEAIKALCAIDQNPDNVEIKRLLLSELIGADDSEYQRVILETLTYYHFDQSDFSALAQIIEKSRALTDSKKLKQYALTLSCIPFEAGLLRSLEIVNSDVWDEYDYCEHYHERDYRGSFIMLLHRPHWADNRPLMHRRIKQLLAQVQAIEISVAKIPSDIKKRADDLSDKISHCTPGNRYENVQFELPDNSVLLRGLGDRHGTALEKQAVVDFLMKGSGSLELQGQQDDQASHAASNNIYSGNNIREVSNYWDQNNGILMAIKASYFNRESQRGFTRTQREFARHFIFLRGIPLWAIEKAFLPESYRYTIERLLTDVSVAELQKDPQFLFNHLDKHRLHQLALSLKEFSKKIIFVTSKDDVYQLLQNHQLHVASDDDILHHTVNTFTQREIMAKECYPNKWQYQSSAQEASITQLFESDYFEQGIDRDRVGAMIKEYFPRLEILHHTNTLEKIYSAIESDSSKMDGMTDQAKKVHFFFLLFRFSGKSKRLYKHCSGQTGVLQAYNLNYQSKIIARYYLNNKASLLKLSKQDIDAVIERIDQYHARRLEVVERDDVLTLNDATFKKRASHSFEHYFSDIFETLSNTRNTHGRDHRGKRINVARHTSETMTGRDEHVGLTADCYPPHSRKLMRLALFLHDAGKDDRYNNNHLFEHYQLQAEPQTVCCEYFSEMTKDLCAPIKHKQHVFASLLIARRALLIKQEDLELSNDDIDLISMIIVHNDLFGEFFQNHITLETLQSRVKGAFDCLKQLPEFKLSESEFIQILYSVYFADAGTVSTVRRNFSPLTELHAKLMQGDDGIDIWEAILNTHSMLHQDKQPKNDLALF